MTVLAKSLFLLASQAVLALADEPRPNPFTWPLPVPPGGVAPACFPVPRLDWMGKFEANRDKLRSGPYEFVFDGDSITENWQYQGAEVWQKYFGAYKPLDLAIGGDQVEHVLWRLENGDLEGQDPKLIVVLAGSANIGQKPEDVADGVKKLVGEYKTRCPHAHILLQGFLPRGQYATSPDRIWAAQVTKLISGFGDDRVTYLDFGAKLLSPDGSLSPEIMPDFLHPSVKGYEIWAATIGPIVAQYLGRPNGPGKS